MDDKWHQHQQWHQKSVGILYMYRELQQHVHLSCSKCKNDVLYFHGWYKWPVVSVFVTTMADTSNDCWVAVALSVAVWDCKKVMAAFWKHSRWLTCCKFSHVFIMITATQCLTCCKLLHVYLVLKGFHAGLPACLSTAHSQSTSYSKWVSSQSMTYIHIAHHTANMQAVKAWTICM